jgi:anti-sigma factor RsiW
MTCAGVEQWLQLYLDGRLDARRLPALERHLAHCAACQADLGRLELVREALTVGALMQQPPDLSPTIMRRVADLEARRAAIVGQRSFAPGWGDGALAAILATLATAIFLIFQPALRQAAATTGGHVLDAAERAVGLVVMGSSSWLAWFVWVLAGLCLTIWLAGSEVRAGWRRALMERLPH